MCSIICITVNISPYMYFSNELQLAGKLDSPLVLCISKLSGLLPHFLIYGHCYKCLQYFVSAFFTQVLPYQTYCLVDPDAKVGRCPYSMHFMHLLSACDSTYTFLTISAWCDILYLYCLHFVARMIYPLC